MVLENDKKNTEFGLIPTDWEYVLFKDVISVFSSGATPYRGKPQYYDGKIRWITSGELNYKTIYDTEEKISEEAVIDTNLKTHPAGTFLIAITGLEAEGTRGRCGFVGRPSTTNQSCMALYVDSKSLDSNYLYHFYVWQGNNLAFKYCQGTKQQSYTAGIAKKLPIILPTLPEQEAIAELLSDTDNLIQSLENKIAKKRLIKQGTIQKLLSPKEGWEEKQIGELAEVVGGGTPSTTNDKFWNGMINWFTPTEIGKSKYVSESHRKITNEGLNHSSAQMLPIGTILLTSRAGIGDLGITIKDACTNQGFQSLIAKKGAHNEFLYYLMLTKKEILLQHASGSTFLEISPRMVRQIVLNVPKYDRQKEIAAILSDIDIEINSLTSKVNKYKNLKQGLLQNLLIGKIRLK